jgi:hypothetical protein
LAILGEKIIVVTPLYFDIKKENCLIVKDAQRLADIEIHVDRKVIFQVYKYRQYLIDQFNPDEESATHI